MATCCDQSRAQVRCSILVLASALLAVLAAQEPAGTGPEEVQEWAVTELEVIDIEPRAEVEQAREDQRCGAWTVTTDGQVRCRRPEGGKDLYTLITRLGTEPLVVASPLSVVNGPEQGWTVAFDLGQGTTLTRRGHLGRGGMLVLVDEIEHRGEGARKLELTYELGARIYQNITGIGANAKAQSWRRGQSARLRDGLTGLLARLHDHRFAFAVVGSTGPRPRVEFNSPIRVCLRHDLEVGPGGRLRLLLVAYDPSSSDDLDAMLAAHTGHRIHPDLGLALDVAGGIHNFPLRLPGARSVEAGDPRGEGELPVAVAVPSAPDGDSESDWVVFGPGNALAGRIVGGQILIGDDEPVTVAASDLRALERQPRSVRVVRGDGQAWSGALAAGSAIVIETPAGRETVDVASLPLGAALVRGSDPDREATVTTSRPAALVDFVDGDRWHLRDLPTGRIQLGTPWGGLTAELTTIRSIVPATEPFAHWAVELTDGSRLPAFPGLGTVAMRVDGLGARSRPLATLHAYRALGSRRAWRLAEDAGAPPAAVAEEITAVEIAEAPFAAVLASFSEHTGCAVELAGAARIYAQVPFAFSHPAATGGDQVVALARAAGLELELAASGFRLLEPGSGEAATVGPLDRVQLGDWVLYGHLDRKVRLNRLADGRPRSLAEVAGLDRNDAGVLVARTAGGLESVVPAAGQWRFSHAGGTLFLPVAAITAFQPAGDE